MKVGGEFMEKLNLPFFAIFSKQFFHFCDNYGSQAPPKYRKGPKCYVIFYEHFSPS